MQSKIIACIFLCGGGGLVFSVYAEENISSSVAVNVSANFIKNTCVLSIENNGTITLDTVNKSYFEYGKLSPTINSGGKDFTVTVQDCGRADELNPESLHFSFRPQSAIFPEGNNQVFINEVLSENGGATGVGVVVFSQILNTNVLNADGTSDVVYDITGQSSADYQKAYTFTARYQNIGTVVPGKVTSNVVVGVEYD